MNNRSIRDLRRALASGALQPTALAEMALAHANRNAGHNGTYRDASGKAIPNRGSHQFTTPGKNHDDDSDWVLVLQVSPTA